MGRVSAVVERQRDCKAIEAAEPPPGSVSGGRIPLTRGRPTGRGLRSQRELASDRPPSQRNIIYNLDGSEIIYNIINLPFEVRFPGAVSGGVIATARSCRPYPKALFTDTPRYENNLQLTNRVRFRRRTGIGRGSCRCGMQGEPLDIRS